jgi:hypothetical protein
MSIKIHKHERYGKIFGKKYRYLRKRKLYWVLIGKMQIILLSPLLPMTLHLKTLDI